MAFRLIPPRAFMLGLWAVRSAGRQPVSGKPFAWLTDDPYPQQRDTSARDYEMFCADILRHAGCKARVTAGTGDQGADIVATFAGRGLVVQCKHYREPVGNKAVQEVHAARAYYTGHPNACVVTEAGYTSSAVDLARKCNVLLLRAENLRFPNAIFRF